MVPLANTKLMLPVLTSSATIPSPRTMMLSAPLMVPNLCAMTRTVLSEPNLSRASWTEFSVRVSRADVASSSTTMEGFFNRHLAMAVRCFSPIRQK